MTSRSRGFFKTANRISNHRIFKTANRISNHRLCVPLFTVHKQIRQINEMLQFLTFNQIHRLRFNSQTILDRTLSQMAFKDACAVKFSQLFNFGQTYHLLVRRRLHRTVTSAPFLFIKRRSPKSGSLTVKKHRMLRSCLVPQCSHPPH